MYARDHASTNDLCEKSAIVEGRVSVTVTVSVRVSATVRVSLVI